MKTIEYPSYISWEILIPPDIEVSTLFPKKKSVRSSAEKIDTESIYTYKIVEVDEKFLQDFYPIYTEYIGSKENAPQHDIVSITLERQEEGRTYEAVCLYEGDILIGAVMYSIREGMLRVSYKAFPSVFEKQKVRATPSMLGDFYLYSRAQELGMSGVNYGRDRNGYGVFGAAIGLAMYKLSIGLLPKVSKNYEMDLLEDSPSREGLFFLLSADKTKVDAAALFTELSEEEQQRKYGSLFKSSISYVTSMDSHKL